MAMRQITTALLDNLRTGFKTNFQGGLKKVTPTWQQFATKVNSSTRIETYGWLGDFPRFRRWVGEKKITRLKEKVYQLINLPYEVTRGIPKHDIQNDNLGLWAPLITGWGSEAAALPERLCYDALKLGHQTECYDGQNFFDTEHPMAGGLKSNMSAAGAGQPWYLLVTGDVLEPIILQELEAPHFHMNTDMKDSHVFKTGEYLAGGEAQYGAGYSFWQLAFRSTEPPTSAALQEAMDYFDSLTDDEGEPLELTPTLIVHGKSTRAAFETLLDKATINGGDGNIDYKRFPRLMSKRLP